MYRLFVAIELPDDLRMRLANLSRELPGGRPVPPGQIHLTLRFIGEVSRETFRGVRDSLASIEAPSFALALRGIGHFPPGRHPRVVWVGIDDASLLLALQQAVETALIGAGIPPEERRFSPHLTLARLKDVPPGPVIRFEEQHRDFAGGPFPVDAFYLFASTLTRAGAIHEKMAVYPLAPRESARDRGTAR